MNEAISKSIRRQFNRSADGNYDQYAKVQRTMADRLANSIRSYLLSNERPNILEIGCGTGMLTERLARLLPPGSELTALDFAPAMLDAAQRRIQAISEPVHNPQPMIHFVLADIELWAASAPSASYHLIVSSACFQWLSHPQETLHNLRRLLKPGGMMAFSTFGPDTFRELHHAFDDAYRSLELCTQRHGLRFHAGDDWHRMLTLAGFSLIDNCTGHHIEQYPSVRDFLQSIKSVGASTSQAKRMPGLGDRRLFNRMFHNYESKFGTHEGIPVTYDLLMLKATAPY